MFQILELRWCRFVRGAINQDGFLVRAFISEIAWGIVATLAKEFVNFERKSQGLVPDRLIESSCMNKV